MVKGLTGPFLLCDICMGVVYSRYAYTQGYWDGINIPAACYAFFFAPALGGKGGGGGGGLPQENFGGFR